MPVPVNVIVARAPRAFVNVASPPLCSELEFEYQLPLYVMLGSFCSTRVVEAWARVGETLKAIRRGKSGSNLAILWVIIIHSSEAASPPRPLPGVFSNLEAKHGSSVIVVMIVCDEGSKNALKTRNRVVLSC